MLSGTELSIEFQGHRKTRSQERVKGREVKSDETIELSVFSF